MANTDQGQQLISLLSSYLSSSTRLNDDDELLEERDKKSLKKHSYNYDDILSGYTTHVIKTLKSKRIMKIVFYGISVAIMVSSVCFVIWGGVFVADQSKNSDFDLYNYIVPVISALTSFLTVFIVIPKIIAKYLFNSNEDTSMKDIIESIQNYDKDIRKEINQNK